jgi:predicted DsbA family dithiol-disulfide isomerase
VAGFLATRGLPYEVHPEIVSNTQNALRVAELARDRALHTEFHARVMNALWAEAEDVSQDDVLRRLATDVGLDPGEVDEVLASEAYWDRVRASTQQAVSFGATAVPAFVLDRRLLVLGAQPDEVFEHAVAQLRVTG